jgi:glucose-6-phosphate isomerase
MECLKIDISGLSDAVSPDALSEFLGKAAEADASLRAGTGPGAAFLEWMDLPETIDSSLVDKIASAAEDIRKKRDAVVIIGIGGSYLGSRAAVDMLTPSFGNDGPEILFAGRDLTGDYHADLLDHLKDKDFAVNIISKSGTTLEPSVVFRILSNVLQERFGADGAAERIVATTDPEKGVLRELADKKGYLTFSIPAGAGGRFSVLTPVGLFPIAAAGIDIRKLLEGARMMKDIADNTKAEENPCLTYAAVRNVLYGNGKSIEILASFNNRLATFCEWWKQLAGESDGKDGKGLFPASVVNSTDLHSLGQWIQEGPRIIFETFLTVASSLRAPVIPEIEGDPDGLNYLAGKTLDTANDAAFRGTDEAHRAGGVPTMTIEIAKLDPVCLGALFYFFERAIAVSGYVLGVNPFDQPGVEAYKKNMFKLLKL